MVDISKEIVFKTARSGGKGGQNVNKVETMVEAWFHVDNSVLLTPEQKAILQDKLANRITKEGFLLVKSQVHRSQLQNKLAVSKNIQSLIAAALRPQKKRTATKPTKSSQIKRVDNKKKSSEIKSLRKKIRSWD